MSSQRLPEQIIPFKLARQRRSLQGLLKLEKMERLTALLADGHGDVAVDLQFGVDEQGISYMRGHLSAEVSLICQRCMESVTMPLETDIAVGFAVSEERASLMPDSYEACLLTEETAILAELIEDELILAMPIVAVHPAQSCQPWFKEQQEELSEAEAIAEEASEKKNPFAVLASLKRDK
jgi:uncharacterized protein